MGHYRSNVRDIEFNLFEVFDLDRVLATGAFGDLDADTARSIIGTAAELAEGPLAAPFASTDRTPPTYDPETFTVTLPADFAQSVHTWTDAGMPMLGLAEELGGIPAPRLLSACVNELGLGASPAAIFYVAGPAFADILHAIGTEEQRGWARLAVERGWGATMALTEPDAGSDVGAGRATATEQPDGSWHLEGVKRFITSADSGDLYENIFHLVLARPVGAGPGTKGLSLFFVPKFHFDGETGELGERNGVYVTNIEHKMGLKGSATCELTFGAHGTPARGWLVGGDHQGIRQMFRVIEHARMIVGIKAIATLSTGYLNALDYAKTRVQGADLTAGPDPTAPRVTVIHHPDVRRSLMSQKAHAEGLRALYLFTAAHQDEPVAEIVSGAEPGLAHRVNDLLLPVVKGFSSERATTLLVESLQTLGGSGYLQDYPIEQYIRDAKIDSLYEGTTAIQAQDLLFRKILRDGGVAFGHVLEQIQRTVDEGDALPALAAALGRALADVQASAAALTGYAMASGDDKAELYKVGLGSVDFLMAFGDLMIGWLLMKQALIAKAALSDGAAKASADAAFYEGKVAVAEFFGRQYLPRLSAVREILGAIDGSVMRVSEAAF